MTDEQVRQNAEAYADHKLDWSRKRHSESPYLAWKEGFEDGAHSRDEEIEELKKQRDNFKDRLLDALEKRDQLRNAWISVEERLPEDAGKVVIVLTDKGDIFNSFLFRNKRGSLIWNSDKGIGKPIFWMPIPSLKGE